MYLIADSGSNKCDWILLDSSEEQINDIQTGGLNPYFQRTDAIKAELWESDKMLLIKDKVKYVFFYGAGCSSERLKKIVSDALEDFFKEAEVVVDHDLVSSSYSTYFGNPVISCILGTGSNSSYFDGTSIKEEVPSLAYILGDEGSGSYFGKILIKEYYYKKLPEDLRKAFNAEYRMSDKELTKKVYSEPKPNIFLASFMPFIDRFKDHPHVKKWMIDGFREFIDIHVKCYENWNETEVSFIGSVAFYFEDFLKEACEIEGLKLGVIMKKPLDNLIRYHKQYVFPRLSVTAD